MRASVRRMALAALLLSAGAAGTGAGAAVGAAPSPSPQASGGTSTPVLSVRRVPGWVVQTVAGERLASGLAAVLSEPLLGAAARTSCVIVDQAGRTLYAANPTEELIPASNMKLLTATAVVDRLGPSKRYLTDALGTYPVRGVLHGNLYLVGSGDPMLYTSGYATAVGQKQYTSLDDLARAVRRAGVTAITGSVVGDEARYDQMRTVPSWKPVYTTEGDVGPLSALEVNDGTSPGPLSGSSEGASATGGAAGPASTSSPAALKAAASTNPAILAALTFVKLLKAEGVRLSGAVASGSTPAGAHLLGRVTSAPLAQEVQAMLTVSDDTAAELFTKEMGRVATGAGTTTAGVAAIRSDLAADRLPVGQLVQLDGSGLSRADRATCELLVDDLQHVGPGSVVGEGLPVAGRTGTLAGRMLGTPAAGRLRAKTGTLDDVASLSGFVVAAAGTPRVPGTGFGQPLVFASVLDGVSGTFAGRHIADQIGVLLAGYPQAPPLAAVEPRR